MSDKKQETKTSFAVFRSRFGNLWVGKIKLESDGKSIFTNFNDAIEKAKSLNDSIENAEELDEIIEEDLEILSAEMKKWII